MKLCTRLHSSLFFAAILSGSTSWAIPIGIIDSGVDLKHQDLVNHAWVNTKEIDEDKVDNDSNGYLDDVHGWNFAEKNNQVIDYSYLGKFSSDVKKFFEIQLRLLNGTATEEDKTWMTEKRKDEKFIQELSTFGNFVHGTHVSGIASKDVSKAAIMAAKLIPTEIKAPVSILNLELLAPFNLIQPSSFLDDLLMQGALYLIVNQQTSLLKEVGHYIATTGMQAANCSFGTSTTQAKIVVGMIGKAILQRDLSPEETEKYAISFINQIIDRGSEFVTSSNKTLFVMAAGNDGTNNDNLPVFPANLKFENTITVAATRDYDRLASFSNYGATKVDIAAPGVGIVSAIPGNEYLALSGTSQAAPFITRLAGAIMDANPKLTLTAVKQIMMQTVDKKVFLQGTVASEGIANEERALRAASLSTQLPLANAILQSRAEVADVSSTLRASGLRSLRRIGLIDIDQTTDGDPIQLPTLLQIKD
jgi:subtilisin family serine protease